MAKDIYQVEPWKAVCPWCGKPISIQHQVAVYEHSENEQFVGVERLIGLGANVKEVRRKLGWKQVTLAKNSGIHQATISRIESGKVTQPKMGQLQKLAKALGVTIDYLAEDSVR